MAEVDSYEAELGAKEDELFTPSAAPIAQANAPDQAAQSQSTAQNLLDSYKKNIADQLKPAAPGSGDGL